MILFVRGTVLPEFCSLVQRNPSLHFSQLASHSSGGPRRLENDQASNQTWLLNLCIPTFIRDIERRLNVAVMAFRGKQMMKKILKKVGEENLAPGVKESLVKYIPKSKVVMGRAQRGIFAGRHIRFGNQVSEDGGNK